MAITIKDISRESGYTIATVSRALNNSPLVGEKTKKRILGIAEEMGYIPNALARGLVTNKLSTIGVIVPDITNPYFPVIVKAIQDKLQENGYTVLLCNSDWILENEVELAKTLYINRVRGIIMDPLSDDTYRNIRSRGIKTPIVFMGNRTTDEDINYVLIDNYKGAVKATEYLISLNHKKISFIGGTENTFINRNRFLGYKDTVIKHFGYLDESLIHKSKYKMEDGYRAIQSFIDEGIIPDAVIACNDIIAFGAIECFRANGYRVPEDVSVIGFDDIEYSSTIGLTTIREPRYDIGCTAAEILLEVMNGASKSIHKQVVFEPELILRKTCCPRK